MPKKVTAWACQHGCHRHVLTSKKAMAEHEAGCYHNPATRACATCGNLVRDTETVYNRHHGGDPGTSDYEQEVVFCEYHDIAEKWRHHCPAWIAAVGRGQT